MKNIISILTLIFILTVADKLFAAEIAVIPYKVINPGMNFSVNSGDDYAKLVAVGAAIKKGLEIYPAFQLKRDLHSFGIDSSSTLTENNINIFAKSRLLNYVVTGSILKTENGFISKSIIYSSSAEKVINTISVKAETLENLAEKEIEALFMFVPDVISTRYENPPVETFIIADTSVLAAEELNELKRKIPQIYIEIKSVQPDSIVYFSNYPTSASKPSLIRSFQEFQSTVDKLGSNARNSNQTYEYILKKGISSILWQKNSRRNIIFITNSQINNSASLMQLVLKAQNKKIKISHVLLSQVDKQSSLVYEGISARTGGFIKDITYHQRLVDGHGNDFHLYYERKRLFVSDLNTHQWKEGILHYSGSNRNINIKISPFADEIDISRKSDSITYLSLDKVFRQVADRTIISKDPVESNLDRILSEDIISFMNLNKNSPLARILLSQFNTSVWINIYNKTDLDFFTAAQTSGNSVFVGLNLFSDNNAPFGISFGERIYTTFRYDDVPVILKSELKTVISDRKKFINNGFLSPPVWFFDVKVEKINVLIPEQDIRN